ncbi:MAG: hypothetical protein R2682_03125 [Pyrinomonadaceae bacterium]
MRRYSVFLIVLLFAGCTTRTSEVAATIAPSPNPSNAAEHTNHIDGKDVSEEEPAQPEYREKTIDMVFPIKESNEVAFKEGEGRDLTFDIDGYTLRSKGLTPYRLEKHGKNLLGFSTNNPRDRYWWLAIAEAKLLGERSKQLYIISSGPGGPCCTNYWIVDISTPKPRLVFRSEEFGRFRDPMEIFDEDGDGIYELKQYDTCMRYFRDDCGSCSPEPSAYFKYDKARRQYRPAKNVMESFTREGLAKTEAMIAEDFRKWQTTKDLDLYMDLHRTVLAHVTDLIHIGNEKRAWQLFKRYGAVVGKEDEAEIRRRLQQCEFYKALYGR